MASRPASVSSLSAKAPTARKCALPSAPEQRSMAKQENTEPKVKKPKVAKPAEGDAPKVKKARVASDYVARLTTHYEKVIRAEMTKQFGYKNVMQVPRITKVVLNMGIGEGVADRKKVDQAASDLSLIAGQKAVITMSRKSIANYKLRDGQAIGCKVTLRKQR